jgi:iron complex transport system substrate-binding protein
MGHAQLSTARITALALLVALFALASCDRAGSGGSGAGGPGSGPRPRVASLSPAATEMLVGIGAGDHLVAVSNWESSPAVEKLPRVGDYQSTDWETLARLRPDVMVVQVAPEHLPPGLKAKADELHIRLHNIKIDRLEDVFNVMQELGAVAGERDKGRDGTRALREKFDRLRSTCATRPSVRTLLVRDENARAVIGPDNFLDDVLRVVNATNAAASLGKAYPSIDAEKIAALKPDAVVVLLPAAKPQLLDVSNRSWAAMTEVPAVRNGRVYTITEGYALVPGPRLADLAQQIADRLRPPAATALPTTTTTKPSKTSN